MRLVVAITVFLMLFKPLFPLLEYATNYDYISKVLCINKEKPQLKCNGKCHLMKELAKAAETEKPASSNDKKSHFETELFCDISAKISLALNFYTKTTFLKSEYYNLYSLLPIHTFFHPPTRL